MINKNELNEYLSLFAADIKRIFSDKLVKIILFGSYATGEEDEESDIDVMILVDIKKDRIIDYRDLLLDVVCKLNFEHDILISPIIQNYDEFIKYKNASGFFKNVEKQGVNISA